MSLTPTGKKKKIQGRNVELFILDKFRKKITKSGTGAHIIVPRIYFNRDAEVKVLVPKPFVCERCIETVSREEHFSPDKRYCIDCYNALQFLKEKKGKLKCERCGKKITEEEFKGAWDNEVCESCWIKEEDNRPIKT